MFRLPMYPLDAALLAASVCASVWAGAAQAATLPEHAPFNLLIVADEVNPHRLGDADLTQPEDLQPALSSTESALNLASVQTVDSQCVDAALTQLASRNAPAVVLYFAHRAAKRCDGSDAQAEFTQLLRQGLERGLGVVTLHHGWYVDIFSPGAKDELLALLGAKTNSINWDTSEGQRVYVVGGEHFVTSNGLRVDQQAQFAGTSGVSTGSYPYFTNVPDELYADTVLVAEAGEQRTPLFATDSLGSRLLGYALVREGWQGRVVAYQPGEYQPNALDDRDGVNFQILVNAIYYAAFGD
ncbi:MAG: hypothetical protein SV422_01075 [Pseudomonadota bacterium]|nr:hypothetical protein [Pseudomonadota bacterium]